MESGDHEIAFLCLCTTNVNGFIVGVPLSTLTADADLVVGLIDQYQQHSIKGLFAPWSQMLSDLAGRSQDVFQWRDEAVADLRTGRVQDTSTSFEIFWTYLSRMHTAFLFGEVELADTCRKIVGFYREVDLNFNSVTMNAFMCCLVACAMYRKTKKLRFLRIAAKELRLMRKFVKVGGVNLVHRLQLMEAEVTSLTKTQRLSPVKGLYDKAISASSRAGFVWDAALANEFCGAFCESLNDDTWTTHYISRAHDLYATWGCPCKLQQLQDRWGSLLEVSAIPLAAHSTFKIRYELFSTRQDLERNFSRRENLSDKIDPSTVESTQDSSDPGRNRSGSSVFHSIEEDRSYEGPSGASYGSSGLVANLH